MAVAQSFSAFIADVSFLDPVCVRFIKNSPLGKKITCDSNRYYDNKVFHYDLPFLALLLQQNPFLLENINLI